MLDLLYSPIPTDLEEFWKIIDDNLEFIETDYDFFHLETEEEALERGSAKLTYTHNSYFIAYRKGDDRYFLEEYFADVKKTYPRVRELAKKRNLTPEFMFLLTRLSCSYGFILNNACVLSNDLGSVIAGKAKNYTIEKKWVAQILLLLISKGYKRNKAEDHLEKYLQNYINDKKNNKMLKTHEIEIRKLALRILNKDGQISSTYREKNFYRSLMEKAASEDVETPPIPEEFNTH